MNLGATRVKAGEASVSSGSTDSFQQLHMSIDAEANIRPFEDQGIKTTAAVAEARRQHVGPNHALMYDAPLHIVRGEGAQLYSADGSCYLDCVNNVAHVGHCHPEVVSAVGKQMGMLNTNSRYLHQGFPSHAEALLSTMPQPLSSGVMYATCSGSESNDLALRVARKHSREGARHVVVMDGAYHGHTSATMDLSPYKFNGPGGTGKPDHVHVMPCPDTLRGTHLDGGMAAQAAVKAVHAGGGRVCAFFSESILSCGGQVVLPPGYLQAVYAVMRVEGAVCVADEVQCGFGRVGSHFWGFDTQSVVPDMVTLGKPIGNGFPMGAVLMTRTLAKAFDNGESYFATCGGCTAASAAGLAVLRVIRKQQLQQAALTVGAHLRRHLLTLQQGRSYIGDVRGLGLMLGIEIVSDDSLAHAPALAHWIKEKMKSRQVLLTTDGAHCDNIIKIKPPMVFSIEDADHLTSELETVLQQFDSLSQEMQHKLLQPWCLTSVQGGNGLVADTLTERIDVS